MTLPDNTTNSAGTGAAASFKVNRLSDMSSNQYLHSGRTSQNIIGSETSLKSITFGGSMHKTMLGANSSVFKKV